VSKQKPQSLLGARVRLLKIDSANNFVEGGPGAIQTPGEIDVQNAATSATRGFSLLFASALGNAPDNVTQMNFFAPAGINFFLITQGAAVPTPLPAALLFFATGLGALGLLGWRRKRKAHAA